MELNDVASMMDEGRMRSVLVLIESCVFLKLRRGVLKSSAVLFLNDMNTCAAVLLVDLTTQLMQACTNLLQAADATDAKQLQLDREIEALVEEKQSEEDLVALEKTNLCACHARVELRHSSTIR